MSAQADEMIALLRSIDSGIKQLVARKAASGKGRRFSDGGDSSGPKPCNICPLRESCKSACATFDQWQHDTGLTRARPGAPSKAAA